MALHRLKSNVCFLIIWIFHHLYISMLPTECLPHACVCSGRWRCQPRQDCVVSCVSWPHLKTSFSVLLPNNFLLCLATRFRPLTRGGSDCSASWYYSEWRAVCRSFWWLGLLEWSLWQASFLAVCDGNIRSSGSFWKKCSTMKTVTKFKSKT